MVARCRDLDVTWLPRHRSQWGGFGHVRATLKGIDHVVGNGVPFDYAVLLTGQDYPLRSPAAIARFLGRGERALVHATLDASLGAVGASAVASTGSRTGTSSRTGGCIWRSRCAEGFRAGCEPYGGSAYWCLSERLVHFVHGFL